MRYGMVESLFMLTSPRFLLLIVIVLVIVLIVRSNKKKHQDADDIKRELSELKNQVAQQNEAGIKTEGQNSTNRGKHEE